MAQEAPNRCRRPFRGGALTQHCQGLPRLLSSAIVSCSASQQTQLLTALRYFISLAGSKGCSFRNFRLNPIAICGFPTECSAEWCDGPALWAISMSTLGLTVQSLTSLALAHRAKLVQYLVVTLITINTLVEDWHTTTTAKTSWCVSRSQLSFIHPCALQQQFLHFASHTAIDQGPTQHRCACYRTAVSPASSTRKEETMLEL